MILAHRAHRQPSSESEPRYRFLAWVFLAVFLLMVIRLAYFQVTEYGLYSLYASDQHALAAKLLPTRGQILVRDGSDGTLHPLATNRLSWQVYAVPKEMKDPVAVAHAVSSALNLPDADIVARLTKDPTNDQYEPIAKDAPSDAVENLQSQNLRGVGFLQTTARLYPEPAIGGQLIGFVSQEKGQYGAEGSFDKLLSGTPGEITAEKDASGHRLTFGTTDLVDAVNGSDVVLTIDRAVQYKACAEIQDAVKKHQADEGTMVVMNPNTGAIIAMCSSPDFDPSQYGKVKNLSVLNNAATFETYEPGSIFKAITLSSGIDANKFTPKTTYNDTGEEDIDRFKIKNADLKAHGIQTMTQVLAQSLNTGTIFAERLIGNDLFQKYVKAFGFGKKTDVQLTPESKGDISSLARKGSIFDATASFGQGITVTPVQILAAYAALGNGGRLVRPYIVDSIIHPDGTREVTKPQVVSQPISSRTSRLITGMLVDVVEEGEGKRAGVPGYWVAGKTGTAQVASSNGTGYQKDVTIGSFAGYAPANDPKFVMLVKINHPRDVQWAESSAAPLFGEMANFLLTYYQVPPERPIGKPLPPPVPPATSSTAAVSSSTRP